VQRRHVAALQLMASSQAVAGNAGLPWPYPADGAQRFLAMALQARAQGSGYHLTILSGGRVVGVCGVKDIDPTGRSGEVGYWLGRDHWGQGIGTRAVAALCSLARDELRLRSLTAWSLEDNLRSVHVLKKNDFSLVRRGRNGRRLVHRDPDEVLLFFERTLG
jgi:8-oxo-dGTP diphosphatase